MLYPLVASDMVYPLDVLCSEERKQVAISFMDNRDRVEITMAFNLPEEYPPYFWKYKRAWLEASGSLTQFALNDFMVMG